MLAAPKVTASSPEIERFSLTQLNNMLLLADRFMDPKEHLLHKLGCSDPAFSYFLRKMRPYLNYNLFETICVRAQLVQEKIQKAENLKCPKGDINHVWARLIKHAFMNGNVFKMNDVRVIFCRTLFIEGLRKLLLKTEESIDPVTKKMLVSFDNIDRTRIQTLLFELLGQLLKSGFTPSVRAIHNFFYLAKKVAKAPESGMTTDQIAVTIAPCVLEAFLLKNVLFPAQPKADVGFEMKRESKFLTLICNVLLNHRIFDLPFNPEAYAEYHQGEVYEKIYGAMMPALTDTKRLNDLHLLETKLQNLRVKEANATSAPVYTSPSLQAALGAVEEEPLWTFPLTGAFELRRSRNLRSDPIVHNANGSAPPTLQGEVRLEDQIPVNTEQAKDTKNKP